MSDQTGLVEVLGAPVSDELLRRWIEWFAPSVQPFFADDASDSPCVRGDGAASMTPEIRDAGCHELVPGAHRLAGTFASSSGPNCFGTVLSAAGDLTAEHDWVLEGRWERWLAESCRRGGRDDDVGTVLVWRDTAKRPVHAAVTIGGSWALEKPGQTRWTPRVVLPAPDLIRGNRTSGWRIERHHITARPPVDADSLPLGMDMVRS